jgi:hypothetical protein
VAKPVKKKKLKKKGKKAVEVEAKPREPSLTSQVLSAIQSSIQRTAPEESTIFQSSVLIKDIPSGRTWREPIGSARRMNKYDPAMQLEFQYLAGMIVSDLAYAGIGVTKEEAKNVPLCKDHR